MASAKSGLAVPLAVNRQSQQVAIGKRMLIALGLRVEAYGTSQIHLSIQAMISRKRPDPIRVGLSLFE